MTDLMRGRESELERERIKAENEFGRKRKNSNWRQKLGLLNSRNGFTYI